MINNKKCVRCGEMQFLSTITLMVFLGQVCWLVMLSHAAAQGTAGLMATYPRWQPGWSKWTHDPSFVNLRVEVSAKADTDMPFTLIAGNASITNLGIGCSTFTTPITLEVPVKIQQPMTFRLLGSNLYEASITIVSPSSTEVRAGRIRRGKPITPAQLKTYIDGEEATTLVHANTNSTCTQYENEWTIEVRPDKNAPRQNSAGRDVEIDLPEGQAPGDGDWPEIGPGKNALPGIAPVRWSVGIGRLLSGKSAGRILYQEMGLSSNSYTPTSLYFYQPIEDTNQVVVVTNAAITNASVLRQIKAPQALVDIPTNTANYTELRFYLPMQVASTINTNTGCFDILTNSPFVVWKLANPDADPAITRRLQIIEDRIQLKTTNEIAYDSTNSTWLLTRGSGPEQYRESRIIQFELDDSYTNDVLSITNRIETNRVTNGDGKLAYEAVETYTLFEWGWELARLVVDPLTNALTTTYYYENIPGGGHLYGLLKRVAYPDGSWEARDYGYPDEDAQAMLNSVTKPMFDTSEDDFVSGSFDCLTTTYTYKEVPETGEWYIGDIRRRADGAEYRYDTNKKQWVWSGLSECESFQIGWLPDCMGALVREGALRFSRYSTPEAAGWPSLTLTNYHVGATNIYAFGSWSDPSFTVGSGSDWRRSSVSGRGTMYDPEGYLAKDSLDVIPGKSARNIEIRRAGVPIVREFSGYTDSFENGTNFAVIHRDYLTNDALGHVIGARRLDGYTAASRTLRTMTWQGTNDWPLPIVLSETDDTGMTYNYTYDSLRRLKTSTMMGANGLPDYTVTFNYDACDRLLGVVTNAGSLTLSNQYVYDLAGRIARLKDHTGSITAYSYPGNGLSTSITYPGGGTYVTTKYLDGERKSETGTTVVATYFQHQYIDIDDTLDLTEQKNTNALARTTYLGPDGTNSLRKSTTHFNMWDAPVWDISGGYSGDVTQFYEYHNSDDNLTAMRAPGVNATTPLKMGYAYDSENHGSASWLHVSSPTYYTLTPASLDRITQTLAFYTNISGSWFRATNTYAYLTDNSATATLVASVRERLNGFAANVKTETILMDAHSNTLTRTLYVDRANKQLTEVTVSASSTLPATNVAINGLLQSQSSLSVAVPATYAYDDLRRPIRATSPTGGAMTTAYESTGRVSSNTDFAGNITSYEYYPTNHLNSGRVKCVTAANGKKTWYEYTARGEPYRIWGDVPYPEQRTYNDFGELVELRTYRGGTGWNAATWPASPGTYDSTTWNFHVASGLLLGKTDASGKSVTNAYYANHNLFTRHWARGVRATNLYSPFGDLFRLGYSDGTAAITYTNWNREGQARDLYDASGRHTLNYDYASRLVSDYCPSGLVAGVTVVNHYHPQYGRDYLEVQGGAFTVHEDFGHDTYGRLNMVSNGAQAAIYGYLPNSDRLQTTAFHSSHPIRSAIFSAGKPIPITALAQAGRIARAIFGRVRLAATVALPM